VFNVLFVGFSLAKNNLNNTYQYNMISKKNSRTMNYLVILIKFKLSRFLCRSVYYLVNAILTRLLKIPFPPRAYPIYNRMKKNLKNYPGNQVFVTIFRSVFLNCCYSNWFF
jgi:hypothetical protein